MARTKGMLNLSGNLEVNAQAPLDARTIVPTEADLTVASNFPYPYIGLEVYVIGTNKKFRLTNLDTTQSSSWQEIGEGGGGETYSDFTGATASTAGAHGLVPAPSAGDEGKVLFGSGLWGNLPSVDLSMLSNEAFIFSTDEKPVGMWTDRKLIYAKTVTGTSASSSSSSATLATIQNVDTFIYAYGDCVCNSNDKRSTPNVSSSFEFVGNDLRFYTNSDSMFGKTINAVMFYTKTTDSPLSADEKFAGVTSGGEVIYEKLFELSALTGDHNYYNHNISNFGNLIDYNGYAEDHYDGSVQGMVIPRVAYDNGNIGIAHYTSTQLQIGSALTYTRVKNLKIKLRYTKTS